LINHLINLKRPHAQWEVDNFYCGRGGRRVTFLDHHELGTWLSQFSLVVSWLGTWVVYCGKAL
jgi:hypothetical protein